jgi:Raf kinase inhibitor-like YbhB/YbcL family protein
VDGALILSTAAFAPGGAISWRYTCYNVVEPSPPLAWSGVPPGAGSLAVVLDAPDRPGGIFTQWLLFNVPTDLTQLPEGMPKIERLDNGALQGRNDFGGLGFAAPCPPVLTTASYRLSLYALDASLDIAPGASESDFVQAAAGHVMDQVQISGTYLRPAWPWG